MLCCAPPYHELAPLRLAGDFEPPYGSVVCEAGHGVLDMLERLAAAVHRWPWISPSVCLTGEEHNPVVLTGLSPVFSERLAVCVLPDSDRPTPEGLVRSIALRKSPSSRALAIWASARLRATDAVEALEEQLARGLGESGSLTRSSATYSRVFRRYSQFTAHDWRALGRLVGQLHEARQRTLPGRPAPGKQPHAVSRAVRRHARVYLGMPWRTATHLAGWEWEMECALKRRGGL